MKAVVVGLDNPHSEDPKMALHPSAFPGSAGSRLYRMVREVDPSVSEALYLEKLERVNLKGLDVSDPSATAAQNFSSKYEGAFVVVLGNLVAANLGLGRRCEFYRWVNDLGYTYVVVPHPSGLTRAYNDPDARLRTGKILVDLIREQG